MSELVNIAKWVDENLAESVKHTRSLRAARIFGVTPSGNGKFRTMTELDSNPDPYDLFNSPPKKEGHEALCLVMTGTMSKIDDDDDEPESFIVRICAAVNDDGVAVVVRREGGSDLEVNMFPDGGEGAFPDALRLWWGADTLIDDLINGFVPNE